MKLSLLVPCYNEEKTLEVSISSCLNQTRPFDELIYIDDCSKDNTPNILKKFSHSIYAYRTERNTGNKSGAQEFGFKFVKGDIIIMTDADTLLDSRFAEEIEKSFISDKSIIGVAGKVQSLSHNWLTLCRAYEYAVGQNIHKIAENYMHYVFVMPGAASAFRVKKFRKNITFDHDTVTEDLDFTYKLHNKGLKVIYNPRAISYTQDPEGLKDYINQLRRWFAGGWQCLVKYHSSIPNSLIMSFEISLLYSEGVIYSIVLFVVFIINIWFGIWLLLGYLVIAFILGVLMAIKEKRWTLVLAPFPYLLLTFINAYVYLEQFIKEVILKKNNLIWFKPERFKI